MSKKLWQQLVSQNMVTIDELTAIIDEMDALNTSADYPKWNELNKKRGALLDDLNTEVMAAYASQPVKSVAAMGKKSFWLEVNKIVNGGKNV